MEHTLFRER